MKVCFYIILFNFLDDNQHKDNIKDIINSLKEEQQHEFDRIEDYYANVINENHNVFKSVGFRSNKGIQILEEKFKLDIMNLIKDSLVKKNEII
jgi:hypothetical protein